MKKLTKLISLLLAICTLAGMMILPAEAAASWPGLSSSAYCEFTATKTIPVYRNTSCTTRGTSSPASSYNAYIAAKDVCKMYKITSSYIQVSYPTSSGYKTGYIKRSALFSESAPSSTYTAASKQTTYVSAGGATYGYVASGDKVYVCGTSGSYKQVIYTAKSGSRAYKLGWIASSDNSVTARLDKIANGSLTYDSSTVMKVGSTFTGTRSSEQCKGYAKNVFYLCFGITPGSTKSNDYQLNATTGMTSLGSITKLTSSSTSTIKNLFANARPGDFVQMKRQASGTNGPHSAIVYAVSSTGVTFLEANTDGKNGIYKNTYTWAQLAAKNQAMTVYTATSYKLK